METAGMWLLSLILFSSHDNHKFKHGGQLDNLNIRAFESLFAFAFPCTTCWLSRTVLYKAEGQIPLTKLDGYFMPSPMRKQWYGRLNDICCKLRTGSYLKNLFFFHFSDKQSLSQRMSDNKPTNSGRDPLQHNTKYWVHPEISHASWSNRKSKQSQDFCLSWFSQVSGRRDNMKDLSLSVLSRGCGRFVSSSQNPGRHDGRLDVCFTPQVLTVLLTNYSAC